jgi:translation initiation factor 2-alpha kinase 4
LNNLALTLRLSAAASSQKPGNIFLDSEGNIRLGDFGLATRRQEKPNLTISETDAEIHAIYDAIEDVGHLLGEGSAISNSIMSHSSSGHESMTGGVGTTFYRAPEQEAILVGRKGAKGESSYGVKADIYSFGIVLFELFHPPFQTYMERSEILTRLRSPTTSLGAAGKTSDRFPPSFLVKAPKNAQEVIVWCLEHDATKRPSAQELLKSDLLPRKIEVEQRYLEGKQTTIKVVFGICARHNPH